MNVLITGANRGIGLGFVKYYLNKGDVVWACYRTGPDDLQRLQCPKLKMVKWDICEDKAPSFLDVAGIPEHLDILIKRRFGSKGPPGKPDTGKITGLADKRASGAQT